MKNLLVILFTGISLITIAVSAAAQASVPHCWGDDNAKVENGVYVVNVSTDGLSAIEYADILLRVQSAPVIKTGEGTNLERSKIELDLRAATSDKWRSSMQYPTFEAVKNQVLAFLDSLAQMKGVSEIRCAPLVLHKPGGRFSRLLQD